jgi:cobalt-zinc-cadmium efflux system outer membrane protein
LWQVESQRYRVRNEVRRQFYETLGAEERLKIADELHQIAEDGLITAQTLFRAQQAARPDVLQARVQLQEVEIIQRNARFQYTASWEQLAALVGLSHLQPRTLQPILFDEQPKRDQETAWAQIAALSPQLQQARADVQRARTQIERERVQPIPNLELNVAAMHMNVSDDNAANVMLGIPVPLFNKNDGNIQRAVAEFHRATRSFHRLELSLQVQLADHFRQYQQALNTAVTYRDEILPAESETLDLIQQAYPLQFDFLRLLTARRSYFEARLEYLEAVIDLRQAEVALDGLLLSGALNDVPDTTLDAGLRGAALSGQ